MKKEIKNKIAHISEDYIKATKKRRIYGVTSRELKEYIDSLKDIDLADVTSFNIGKILSESLKFTCEMKYSSRYGQELNHWKLK